MKQVPIDTVVQTYEAAMSEAFARAFALGMDECAELGIPLTQLQRNAILKMVFSVYGDTIKECREALEGSAIIEQIKDSQ